MILSDSTIIDRLQAGSIVVRPLDDNDIQPASIDLQLAPEVRVFKSTPGPVIDVTADNSHLLTDELIPQHGPFLLQPGAFALASTVQTVEIPDDILARLDGKSSLGRLGLLVHATAGYIDPGFQGTITLELANATALPITLYRYMRIAQISFMQLTTPALRPYGTPGLGSKYQGQNRPTPSRVDRDFLSQHTPTENREVQP